MIIEAREQIKLLASMKAVTLKRLAELITEKTGKKCTLTALSNKLRRGTITYNEVMKIVEILGFKVSYDFE